ncbi:MAG: toll/interleukin-1 receptor domain-containing protein [Aliishimia sp.]
MQAFFSYATRDWDAPADGELVQQIVTGIEAQVRAEIGDDTFTLWRDQEKLRWGDDWKAKLEVVVAASDLLIVLLSPSWFRSDYCMLEYDVFYQHGADGRILPILLREIDQDHLSEMTQTQRTCFGELRRIQTTKWPDLTTASFGEPQKLLKNAAVAIRTCLVNLTPSEQDDRAQADTSKATAVDPTETFAPIDGNLIPPVSGDYYCPSQGQGACMLRLAVAGLAEVETEHGSVLFEISALTIQTKVTGARIVNDHADFATGWDGPIARVTRIQTGVSVTALSIEAHGNGLRGEPLVGLSESGHVRLFDLEPKGDAPIKVEGTVRIARKALRVLPAGADRTETATEREKTITKLTDILLEKHVHEDTALEGWIDE